MILTITLTVIEIPRFPRIPSRVSGCTRQVRLAKCVAGRLKVRYEHAMLLLSALLLATAPQAAAPAQAAAAVQPWARGGRQEGCGEGSEDH